MSNRVTDWRTDIIEVLRQVGIPRCKFQIAQLIGHPDNLELKDILRHMVLRGEIVVVKGPVPKRYALPSNKAAVVHEAPRKAFALVEHRGPYAVAGPIEEKYKHLRWWTKGGRLA